MNRGRLHSAVLVAAIAITTGACSVDASNTHPTAVSVATDHPGEAPEPQGPSREVVEPDNRPIDESDQNYWASVDRALAVGEPDPATLILADIETALGLDELRLIGTKVEDMTDGQWREELKYLLDDGSILSVWWQTLHPDWDRTPLTDDELLVGWPDGVDAALDDRSSGHVQVVFRGANILGSVMVSKPPIPGAGVPEDFDAARVESLARAMYDVLAGT